MKDHTYNIHKPTQNNQKFRNEFKADEFVPIYGST